MNNERAGYIANCIDRILAADCHNSKARMRALDLAEAIYIRAKEGEAEAHKYLIELCVAAEAGKYGKAEGGRNVENS